MKRALGKKAARKRLDAAAKRFGVDVDSLPVAATLHRLFYVVANHFSDLEQVALATELEALATTRERTLGPKRRVVVGRVITTVRRGRR